MNRLLGIQYTGNVSYVCVTLCVCVAGVGVGGWWGGGEGGKLCRSISKKLVS